MSSNSNRLYNTQGERAFVTTQSVKKLKKFLKDWVLDPEGWKVPGESKLVNLDDIRKLENDKNIYYKERWIRENGLEQKLIVTYSPVYQRYQSAIREKQVERASKKIERPGALNKPKQTDPKRLIKAIHVTDDAEIADKTQGA